jgi:hypothetical protein
MLVLFSALSGCLKAGLDSSKLHNFEIKRKEKAAANKQNRRNSR